MVTCHELMEYYSRKQIMALNIYIIRVRTIRQSPLCSQTFSGFKFKIFIWTDSILSVGIVRKRAKLFLKIHYIFYLFSFL